MKIFKFIVYKSIDVFFRIVAKLMSLQSIKSILLMKQTKNKFIINGQKLPYLFSSYNNYGITERSAEIPLIYYYLTIRKFNHVLEIGNVTNYYNDYFSNVFPNKTVVDKLEYDYNVITNDISKYHIDNDNRFDLIFSISTFEHMDSDLGRNLDYISGSSKFCSVAADNIVHCYENLLDEGGLMIIIAPLGYTPEWDKTFKSSFLEDYSFRKFERIVYRRVSEQEWIQEELINLNVPTPYGKPFPFANYLSVIEIYK